MNKRDISRNGMAGRRLMRFHLFYQGPLYSEKVDIRAGQRDRRADHKHEIRRIFHTQLKTLWGQRRFLRETVTNGEILGVKKHYNLPLQEMLAELGLIISIYRFVPLVHERFDLTCSLNVLILRRDRPGNRPDGISTSRDIDNRLKIILDALKMPCDSTELGSASPLPNDADNPMYVLLQKDELVTKVTVEAGDVLDPPPNCDDSYTWVLIHVDIGLWSTNMFNLGFG